MKEKFLKTIRSVTRDILDDIQRIVLVLVVMLGVPFVYFGSDGCMESLAWLCNAIVEVLLVWCVTAPLWRGLKNMLRFGFFLFAFLDFLMNLFCYLSVDSLFEIEHAYILLGTNVQEAREYLSHYFSIGQKVLMVIGLAIIFVAYFRKIWRARYSKTAALVLMVVALLCGGVSLKSHQFHHIAPLKEYVMYRNYQPAPRLADYRHDLKVETSDELPINLVIIIGESFAKSHSSLYGYEKVTNPMLQTLVDEGKLTVYNDVVSADVTTTPSFKAMLTTYKRDSRTPWFQCVTIYDVLGSFYKTYWLSNQCRVGFYDNVQSSFADLSDYEWFAEEGSLFEAHYDGALIPKYHECLHDSASSRLIFINLMGEHEAFVERYPASFSRFVESDYLDKSQHQREVLATYDNAVLYNDSVVYEMMRALDSTPSLAIYFPDHGLDIFETDPAYAGHGRSHDEASYEVANKIPFLVYESASLKETNPGLGGADTRSAV